MKKFLQNTWPFLVLFFCFCCFAVAGYSIYNAYNADAATITCIKNGNIDDPAMWDLGRVPADGDDVNCSYAVKWLQTSPRFPATGTLKSINLFSNGMYSYVEGGHFYATTVYNLYLAEASTTQDVYYVFGLNPGEGIQDNGIIDYSGTGTLHIQGRITAINSNGLYITRNGAIYLDGIIQGSDVATTFMGVHNVGSNVTLSPTTQLIQGTYSPAWWGKAPAWQPSGSGGFQAYTGTGFGQSANTNFPVQLPAASIKYGVPSGNVTGTYQGKPGFGGNQ